MPRSETAHAAPCISERTHVVHTEGNRKARLMFVGEAPGADEDAQARPFVGRAGQLLTKIIEAIGLKREEVLIGNVNRCRPPGNQARRPLKKPSTCKPFLLREIAVVQPEVIVVLGNTAMKNLLDTREGITRLRGRFQDYKGIKVMPTFHPAYLLRDPSKKRETWEDLKMVRDYLDSTKKSSPLVAKTQRMLITVHFAPWRLLRGNAFAITCARDPYAEVAVPLHVFQTFTYRLTPEQSAHAQVGARLVVPLGRNLVTGYIVALLDELPEDHHRDVDIKDAHSLVDYRSGLQS